MPELPTPPNGRSRTSGCTVQSLTAASPDAGDVEDPVGDVRVLGEHVEAERARPGIDEVDHLLDAVDFQHRQDRSENLLLHDGRVRATRRPGWWAR